MIDMVPFSDFYLDFSKSENLVRLEPILQAKKIEDLMYYDGPLLTHFRNDKGESFLLFWVDMEENRSLHRWMYMKVSQESIDHLKRTEHYCSVIPDKSLNETVLFLDMCGNFVLQVYVVPVSKIPREEYMPEKTIYIGRPTQEQIERTYELLKMPRIGVH